jgi:DNA-binding NtrC family response regulator
VKPVVFLVDDEPRMTEAMATALARLDCTCQTFQSGADALAALLDRGADVVVSDWRMPGIDGLELMRRVRAARPGTAVILITAYAEVPSAVSAMRQGAFDYLTKPFDNHELRTIVVRALDLTRLERENRRLREQLGSRYAAEIVAGSDAMRAVLTLVDRAAGSKASVLIQGESGTGKEVVARRVHVASPRVAGPFVAVNCRAFADSVLESELFGHEKGAFTGAVAGHAGCFERADGGTLFLDEIGDVGQAFQAKLLRVLQEGEVLRVGGHRPHLVDVRIVAATNRDLTAEVAAGRFREDLYFRLNVIPVVLPPLRDRRDDVLPLADHFLLEHARDTGRRLTLDPSAAVRLTAHRWPGNVRELQNVLQRATVLARGSTIGPEDLLFDRLNAETAPMDESTLQETLEHAAADRIRAALAAAGGRKAEAAAGLGIDRTTLFRWMRRLGLSVDGDHNRS